MASACESVSRLKDSGALDHLVTLDARRATVEEIAAVHAPDYIERVRWDCIEGESCIDTPDVSVCPESYDVAVLAAGGGLAASQGN